MRPFNPRDVVQLKPFRVYMTKGELFTMSMAFGFGVVFTLGLYLL